MLHNIMRTHYMHAEEFLQLQSLASKLQTENSVQHIAHWGGVSHGSYHMDIFSAAVDSV